MLKKICLTVLLISPLFIVTLYSEENPLTIRLLIYEGDGKDLSESKNNLALKGDQFRYQNEVYSIQSNKMLKVSAKKPIVVKGISYFGKIKILRKQRKYQMINFLPLELYLQGILQAEISYSWNAEAIKAQAIAARSYALYSMNESKAKNYDVVNSERNQVFSGVAKVHPNIAKNVLATKGVVMVHRNKPIQAFFHASCGGMTEKAENVWSSAESLKYFKPVRCHYCTTHPKYEWDYQLGKDELQRKITEKLKIKKVKSIKITKKTSSKRIKRITVTDEKNKKHHLTGNQLRILLEPSKLLSTKFSFTKKNNKYYFKGKGYGHGVGLCQWGAKTMAERGFNHKRILKFYYKNIKIKPLDKKSYLALK